MNAQEQAVATVLASYQDALNPSSTEVVMKLYPSDGVFMPQHFPSSAGADEVRKEYDGVFAAITLSVKFEIAEIRQIVPDWAFARTNSAGIARVNATRRGRPGGQPGTLRLPEDRRRMEDRATASPLPTHRAPKPGTRSRR
jgi:ketosteroid isomerase-like protein